MSEKNYYLGIDLGTTNIVMSYARYNLKKEKLDIKSLRFKVTDEEGGKKNVDILPSYVYFKENEAPIVGPFAKGMMGIRGNRVIKSIKSDMGKDLVQEFDGKFYKPEDISALMLKNIAKLSEKTLKHIPEDVVITVPASFNSDQKLATIKAAEKAGFKTKNSDGSSRNILLTEPRAALFNFVYEWKNGNVPSMELNEAKNVLVFDLGGGTLDVSLHRLDYNLEKDDIKIEDYAISRYTKIGGDNFDIALAKLFRKHLIDKGLRYSELDNARKKELGKKLISIAELEKVELNSIIQEEVPFIDNKSDIDGLSHDILIDNVYDNFGINMTITAKEYRTLVEDLLGRNMQYDDYKKLNNIDFSNNNNIIYPILDVLSKAKNIKGEEVKIDGILLNGGMSKLYFIQERLEDFFGIVPMTDINEDKAVAYGATYYHYKLHEGSKFTATQNESIGIQTGGNFVKHLVKAGQSLPFSTTIAGKFEVTEDGATTLVLPFYLGERVDIKLPNKKIAERRIKFKEALREGTGIDLKIEIDEAGLMTVEGWKAGDYKNKFMVEVLSDKIEESKEVRPRKTNTKRRMQSARQGAVLGVKETIEVFKKSVKNGVDYKGLIRKILDAKNGNDFVIPLLKLSNNGTPELKSKAIILLGNLIKYHEELREQVARELVNKIHPDEVLNICNGDRKNLNRIIKEYINTIGKTEQNFVEGALLYLLNDILGEELADEIVVAIGKTGYSKNALVHLLERFNDMKKVSNNTDPEKLLWSLAKITSRERDIPLPINYLDPLIHKSLYLLDIVEKKEVFEKLVYLLGEMCDTRIVDDINVDLKNKVIEALQDIYEKRNSKEKKLIDLTLNMIKGNELTEDQANTLLAIRSTL